MFFFFFFSLVRCDGLLWILPCRLGHTHRSPSLVIDDTKQAAPLTMNQSPPRSSVMFLQIATNLWELFEMRWTYVHVIYSLWCKHCFISCVTWFTRGFLCARKSTYRKEVNPAEFLESGGAATIEDHQKLVFVCNGLNCFQRLKSLFSSPVTSHCLFVIFYNLVFILWD